jgi:hypothetical protein
MYKIIAMSKEGHTTPHTKVDPFEILKDISGDSLDIIHRDHAAHPELVDEIKHKSARSNIPLAINTLNAAIEAEAKGLTPQEAYLEGFRDVLALLQRQAIIYEAELHFHASGEPDPLQIDVLDGVKLLPAHSEIQPQLFTDETAHKKAA